MNKYRIFSPIFSKMEEYRHLGEKVEDGDYILIGRAPHIAKFAYLHTVYHGLNANNLEALEQVIQNKLPSHLVDLYSECNGFTFFSDTLSMNGLRMEGMNQPYGIEDPNIYERISDASDELIFFAGYSEDGSNIYTKTNDEKVYWCGRDSVKPKKIWPSIALFIAEEAERIGTMFDEKGVQIDKRKSTLPF